VNGYAQNRTAFAPPNKDRKTSYESKNQKAGVFKREGEPNLRKILPHDLRSLERMDSLYAQAARCGWIQPSEANALNFLAAAVRAQEVGRDAPRVFVTLVRRGLWHHITQAQEDHARAALVRWRDHHPECFRVAKIAA
jgi:hypothetical protein